MSVMTLRRAANPTPTSQRRLRLLPPPRPTRPVRRRGAFAIVLVAVLVSGLIGLLLLNTVLAQQAFRLHDLERRATSLGDVEQQLREQVDQLTQPDAVATRAAAQGMVPGCDPGFVRADGTVVGTVTKVTGLRRGSLLIVPAPAGSIAAPCPGSPAAFAAAVAARAAAEKAAADAAAHPGTQPPAPPATATGTP
jgi:hypothetical protein